MKSKGGRELFFGFKTGKWFDRGQSVPLSPLAPASALGCFDTSLTVRLRSPLSTVPAGIIARRFRNAHHHDF
jgi:hypothetical protein